MKTTRTLMLAAAAALSLGVGSAMAQDGGGGAFPDYQSQRVLQQRVVAPTAVQSGSSDVDTTGNGLTADYIFNNHLYGAGGVAG